VVTATFEHRLPSQPISGPSGAASRRGTRSRTGSPLSAKWPSACRVTAVIEVRLSLADAILVGDVGGTHARFALVDTSDGYRIHHRKDLTGNFATFTEALRGYLEGLGLDAGPRAAAIAVAGPVTDGSARFTNRGWDISERELLKFGFERALLVNDFAVLAFAAEVLQPQDLRTVGPEIAGLPGGTITIVGPGTGFGVSCLARDGERAVQMATEGGHIGFAPGDDGEVAALQALRGHLGRVSVERILSGSGLENLYRALEQIAGREARPLGAAQITTGAAQGDLGCRAALTMFCAVFGAVAGDLALAHGARGGVYIAGGIAQKIEGFLVQSPFRARFEDKGRLSPFVKAIPTKLIVNSDVALLGAARAGTLPTDGRE
jgi:glucokinase